MAKKKKTKKKLIIIGVIVLVIILIIGVVLLLLPKEDNKIINKTKTGTDWGDIYYDYLSNEEHKIPDNSKIGLIESENYEAPILYTMYDKKINNNETYYDIDFHAIKDGEVISYSHSTPGLLKVKLLYDVKNSKYRYYLSETINEEDLTLIEPEIKYTGVTKEDKEYEKYKEEAERYSVRTDGHIYKYVEGAGQDIGKKEEYVIDVDVEEILFDYSKDKKEFQENLKKGIKEYKDLDKIITKDIEKKVEEVLNNKDKVQDEPQTEIDTEKAPTQTGLQIGDYTIKYGKYKACVEEVYCEEFTIREDGTANFNGEETKYHIEKIDFAQGVGYGDKYVHPALIIERTPSGNGGFYTPYGTSPECLLTDGDLTCVNFVG